MIHLLTGWSPEFDELARITYPGKALYASKHGYGIKYFSHPQNSLMAWNRPLQWLSALHSIGEGDWLFFTGCDTVITNHRITVESLIDQKYDLIASTDYIDIQGYSMLMRNCLRARRWLARVLTWEDKANNEQEAMSVELSEHIDYHRYYRAIKAQGINRENVQAALNGKDMRVQLLPQKMINAYPMECYRLGEAGNDQSAWSPGDFIAHLPCKSLADRIEIMPKILIASASFMGDK